MDEQEGYDYAKLTDRCNIDIYWVRDNIEDIASSEFMQGYNRYIKEKEEA